MTTTERGSTGNARSNTGAAEDLTQTARSVADTVAGAAGEVSARLPEVAQSTREALAETNRLVRQGSDQSLKVLGAASVGLATGLLIGGANRLLVVAAMLPAALIGATLVERAEGTTVTTPRAGTGSSRS
jgi:hypothetical protein